MNRKRTILVIAVIALLAVAIYGGQALAAKPSGSSVAIETGYYSLSVTHGDDALQFDYPQVRHISLTVHAGVFEGGFVNIACWTPLGGSTIDIIDTSTYETYEFNGDKLNIWAHETVEAVFYITTTYER